MSSRAPAVAQLRKAVEQSGRAPFLRAALAHALARAGDEPAARRLAEELEGTEAEAVAVPIAWAHCALGDPDEAAKWAERGFERRSPLMVNLGWFPWWEELRAHPTYRDLATRMRLPIVLDSYRDVQR